MTPRSRVNNAEMYVKPARKLYSVVCKDRKCLNLVCFLRLYELICQQTSLHVSFVKETDIHFFCFIIFNFVSVSSLIFSFLGTPMLAFKFKIISSLFFQTISEKSISIEPVRIYKIGSRKFRFSVSVMSHH